MFIFLNYNFRRITYYSVTSTTEAAFVIGGWDTSALDAIAKFEKNNWSLYGNLQKPRDGHGSLTYGTQTIVIGGETNQGS